MSRRKRSREQAAVRLNADVNETAAIVYGAKKYGQKSAILIIGGGSPKNFVLQTEPQIQEVLGLDEKGHDYYLQFTDARVIPADCPALRRRRRSPGARSIRNAAGRRCLLPRFYGRPAAFDRVCHAKRKAGGVKGCITGGKNLSTR